MHLTYEFNVVRCHILHLTPTDFGDTLKGRGHTTYTSLMTLCAESPREVKDQSRMTLLKCLIFAFMIDSANGSKFPLGQIIEIGQYLD